MLIKINKSHDFVDIEGELTLEEHLLWLVLFRQASANFYKQPTHAFLLSEIVNIWDPTATIIDFHEAFRKIFDLKVSYRWNLLIITEGTFALMHSFGFTDNYRYFYYSYTSIFKRFLSHPDIYKTLDKCNFLPEDFKVQEFDEKNYVINS